MAVKYDPDKFIMITTKDLLELPKQMQNTLQEICVWVEIARRERGADPYPKYYVCNQDEPYAQEVLRIILDGEKEKEAIDGIENKEQSRD